MRRPSFNPGRTKNLIHGFQGFLIFLGWALTIAVFTKGGGIDGRSGWYFALCWISIPALIYLVAVPMWPRARRFGNVYAFATVDTLFAVLWFSAWVAIASYVAQGKSEGKDEGDQQDDNTNDDEKASGCDNWKYGSASKCNVSTASCIIGVVIFVLFALTAFMSFRNVMHFRRTGTLPDAVSDPTFAAQSKAAFSSNPAQDFEEEDDFRSGRAGMGSSMRDRDEDYALLHQSEVDDLGNPNGRSAMHGAYDPTESTGGSVLHDYNTGYGGAHGQHYAPPSEYDNSTVSGYNR
ncbi:chaperone binding protein [Aspergillus insuetus]